MKRKRSPARHPVTQGGKRKGAGRPALGKVLLRAKVLPATLKEIQHRAAVCGVPLGAVIDANIK